MSKKMINTEILKLVNGCFETTVKRKSDIISEAEFNKHMTYIVSKVTDIMVELPKETVGQILHDSIDQAYICFLNDTKDRLNEFTSSSIQEAYINICVKFQIMTRRFIVKPMYNSFMKGYKNKMIIHDTV